ncbi:MAG TPA: XRE family transcriptional regulator [Dehalococcoidia bacterium]|nr:XRE family transcriptional regulator [Dehalococcoidia bacterium]
MKKEKQRKRITAKTKAAKHEDLLTDTSGTAGEAVVTERGALGARIREARETRGLTLEDISSRTGIDVAALQRMESGETVPPLGQLIRLGKALDMKMGYFISPGVEKPMTVVRKEERRVVARYGQRKAERYGYFYESLAPEKADRMMEPFIVTLLPTDVEELSTHDGQEFLFVLDGDMKVQVGDEVELLKPGDAVYYDSTQPHLVKSATKGKTTILAVLYTGAK